MFDPPPSLSSNRALRARRWHAIESRASIPSQPSRRILRAAFALALAFSGASQAQPQEFVDGNQSDDLLFARHLARHRYFDLAFRFLDRVEHEGGNHPVSRRSIASTRASIARYAAQIATTSDDRIRFLELAIQEYRHQLGTGAPEDVTAGEDAIDGLATTLVERGRAFAERARQEVDVQASKATLAQAESTFQEAIDLLDRSARSLSAAADRTDLPGSMRARLSDLSIFAIYRRGEAYHSFAQIYPLSDLRRRQLLAQCDEAMNDYIWEAGDDRLWSFFAAYYQGVANGEMARTIETTDVETWSEHDEKALAMLEHVTSSEGLDVERLKSAGIPSEDLALVLEVVERSILASAEIYRRSAERFATLTSSPLDVAKLSERYGLTKESDAAHPIPNDPNELIEALRRRAVATVDDWLAIAKRVGLDNGEFGQRAELERARALSDLGQRDAAVERVRELAAARKDSALGEDAERLLAEWITPNDSQPQPVEVWSLLGKRALSEGRALDAIDAFQAGLSALEQSPIANDKDARSTRIRAWQGIGDAYAQMSRHLEAAIAYETGLELSESGAEPEITSELAIDSYNAWNRRFLETKDAFDQAQRDRVRERVTRLGASSDVAYFAAREQFANAQAEKADDRKKAAFAKAIEDLAKVPQSSIFYERALVFRGRAELETAGADTALATLDALIAEASTATAENGGSDPKRRENREIALAEATYHRAGILLRQRKDFAAAEAALANFETRFAAHQTFFPQVLNLRIAAAIGRGDLASAESLLARLLETAPTHAATTQALNVVATAEYEAAKTARDRKDDKATADALARAATHLSLHNERTGFASFVNLHSTADWNLELARLASERGDELSAKRFLAVARDDYRRLLDKFAGQSDYSALLEKDLPYGLAQALVGLDDLETALPILSDLAQRFGRDPAILRDYARCVGGYLSCRAETIVVHRGVDEPSTAIAVWNELIESLERGNQRGTPRFWDARVQLLYAYVLASGGDDSRREQAKLLLRDWRQGDPQLGGPPWSLCFEYIERELLK